MKENWIGKELDLDLCWRTNLIVQITLAQKPGTKRIFEAFTTEIFSFNIRVFCQIEQISNLGFRFVVYLPKISSQAYFQSTQELDDEFDFVLLAEHFDESLVILARKICRDLEEVGGQMLLKVHLYMRDVSGGGGLRAT